MSETTEARTQPGSEIATRPARLQASLPAKIQYARALAESGLLPAAYRGNPGNVLYAVEYGDMLGLSPMAAITGVHIIEGKPGASAGLISALVRRAGHKLRVTGDARSATCQIIRCDDPDYVFAVTWTFKRNTDDNPSAEEAGLANKNTWKLYPASMLKSRAITQCARDACEEALFGLHYTPEELGADVDADGNVLGEVVDDGSEDREWFEDAMKRAQVFADDAAGNAIWAEVVKRKQALKLTVSAAEQIKNTIRGRAAELAQHAKDAEPVEGVIVIDPECYVGSIDPEDPWLPAVDAITSAEDGQAVLDEIAGQLSEGKITPERAEPLMAVIRSRIAKCTGEQVAA